MNVIESNKLIAEFAPEIVEQIKATLFNAQYTHPDNYRFHSSYDWLMPVVEKIYAIDLYYKWKDLTARPFKTDGIELSTNINSVYEQVTDFLEWYNETKKS